MIRRSQQLGTTNYSCDQYAKSKICDIVVSKGRLSPPTSRPRHIIIYEKTNGVRVLPVGHTLMRVPSVAHKCPPARPLSSKMTDFGFFGPFLPSLSFMPRMQIKKKSTLSVEIEKQKQPKRSTLHARRTPRLDRVDFPVRYRLSYSLYRILYRALPLGRLRRPPTGGLSPFPHWRPPSISAFRATIASPVNGNTVW